ncbi:MAG: anhydro-N-acetylmuramic acid kinase [Gammaproteobacteria bacterium]|nr:anhydro-N-acetylmuramic acid kinase [Gammaproteobacteria bacterium]
MSTSRPELYIGLMSGTSMDSIDAALIDLSSTDGSRTQPRLVHSLASRGLMIFSMH